MIFGKKNHGQFWEKRVVFEQPLEIPGKITTNEIGIAPVTHEEAKRRINNEKEKNEDILDSLLEKDGITDAEQRFFDELKTAHTTALQKIQEAKTEKVEEFGIIMGDFVTESNGIIERAGNFSGVTPEEMSSFFDTHFSGESLPEGTNMQEIADIAEPTEKDKIQVREFLDKTLSENINLSEENKTFLINSIANKFKFPENFPESPAKPANGSSWRAPFEYLKAIGIKVEGNKITEIPESAINFLNTENRSGENVKKDEEAKEYARLSAQSLDELKDLAPHIINHMRDVGLYPSHYGGQEAMNDFLRKASQPGERGIWIGDTKIRNVCEIPEALQKKKQQQLPQWENFLGEKIDTNQRRGMAKILTDHFDMSSGENGENTYYKYEFGERKPVEISEIKSFLKREAGVSLENIDNPTEKTADIVDEDKFKKATQESDTLEDAINKYVELDNEIKAKAKEHGNMMKWIFMLLISIFKGENILEAYDNTNKKMIKKDLKKQEDIGESPEGNQRYAIEFKRDSNMMDTFWEGDEKFQKEIIASQMGVEPERIKSIERAGKNSRRIDITLEPTKGLLGTVIDEGYKKRSKNMSAYPGRSKIPDVQTTIDAIKQYDEIFYGTEEARKIMKELDNYGGIKMITAIIAKESTGDTNAVSKAGAAGLMQQMPITALDTMQYAEKNGLMGLLEDAYRRDGITEGHPNAGLKKYKKLKNSTEYNNIKKYEDRLAYLKKNGMYDTGVAQEEVRKKPHVSIALGMIHLHELLSLLKDKKEASKDQVRHTITGAYNEGRAGKIMKLWKKTEKSKYPKTAQGIVDAAGSGDEAKDYVPKINTFFESITTESNQTLSLEEKEKIIAYLKDYSQSPVINKNQLEKTEDSILIIMEGIGRNFGHEIQFSSTASLRENNPNSDHAYGMAVDIVIPRTAEEIKQGNNATTRNGLTMNEQMQKLTNVAESVVSTYSEVEMTKKQIGQMEKGDEVSAGGFFMWIHKNNTGNGMHLHISDRRNKKEGKHYRADGSKISKKDLT